MDTGLCAVMPAHHVFRWLGLIISCSSACHTLLQSATCFVPATILCFAQISHSQWGVPRSLNLKLQFLHPSSSTGFFPVVLYWMGFPGVTSGKEPPCQCWRRRRQVRPLGQEDPLKKGMATHSSILAWRTSWTEEPVRLQSMGLQRAGHNWVTNTSYSDITSSWLYLQWAYFHIRSCSDALRVRTSASEFEGTQFSL